MLIFSEEGGRPGDRRGFIHKKILGGVSRLAGIGASIGIPGARAVSTITRALAPRTETARVTQASQFVKQRAAFLKFPDLGVTDFRFRGNGGGGNGAPGGCPDPLILAPDGHCVARGSGHFQQHFGRTEGGAQQPVGDAVMGRYGAALTPGSLIIDRAVCLKGMQLGDDGLCYNKSQISNKQRMWPAGRKPLLSGGDMRAIGIAARAGRRVEGATKRLQRLGMMKKPASRRALPPPVHQRLLEAHVTK